MSGKMFGDWTVEIEGGYFTEVDPEIG